MAFCTKCGKELVGNTRFCTKCGAPTTSATPAATAVVPTSTVNQALTLTHLNEVFLTKPEFADGSCKIFEGLYTDVAVSQSGYIGFYRPLVPAQRGGFAAGSWGKKGELGKTGGFQSAKPASPEYYKIFHVSEINDIDIDIDEDTKVSTGAGGTLLGGLIGGTVGALVGGAATGGKVKTKVNGIHLTISTKDFQNPRHVIPLYAGEFQYSSIFFDEQPPSYKKMRTVTPARPNGFGGCKRDAVEDVYNDGNPPIDKVNELTAALHQLVATYAETQAATASAPQVSAADEILKFKQLLDAGVITQEDFDTKKQQLIG